MASQIDELDELFKSLDTTRRPTSPRARSPPPRSQSPLSTRSGRPATASHDSSSRRSPSPQPEPIRQKETPLKPGFQRLYFEYGPRDRSIRSPIPQITHPAGVFYIDFDVEGGDTDWDLRQALILKGFDLDRPDLMVVATNFPLGSEKPLKFNDSVVRQQTGLYRTSHSRQLSMPPIQLPGYDNMPSTHGAMTIDRELADLERRKLRWQQAYELHLGNISGKISKLMMQKAAQSSRRSNNLINIVNKSEGLGTRPLSSRSTRTPLGKTGELEYTPSFHSSRIQASRAFRPAPPAVIRAVKSLEDVVSNSNLDDAGVVDSLIEELNKAISAGTARPPGNDIENVIEHVYIPYYNKDIGDVIANTIRVWQLWNDGLL